MSKNMPRTSSSDNAGSPSISLTPGFSKAERML